MIRPGSAPTYVRRRADRAMDVVNIKISKFGGLTKARQARDLCVSLGIAMTIEDSWGGDIVMQYLLQTGSMESFYDLDDSGTLDQNDLITLVEDGAGTRMGDADLDGDVDATDFSTWSGHNFQFVTCNGWSEGDFNGDDRVDVRDFNLWNDNKFLPAPADVPAEPAQAPRAPLAATLNDGVTVATAQIEPADTAVVPTFIYGQDSDISPVAARSQIELLNHNGQRRDDWFATLERRGTARDKVDTLTASRFFVEKPDVFGNLTDWL